MVLQYRKRFGQHFLKSEQIIQKIIQAINPNQKDTLIEIGPGMGAITQHLIKKTNHFYAIEIDRDIAKKLNETFTADELTLYCQDVLQFDFSSIKGPQKIVGNLPYNISTPLLFYLSQFSHQIEIMYFMLQKEVADRLTAQPGSSSYGRLSVLMQYDFLIEPLFNISPDAFFPKPKVESTFISIKPKKSRFLKVKDKRLFEKIIKIAFSQKRKILRNTLKPLFEEETLKKANINPNGRAEELSINDFVRLTNLKISTGSTV